MPNYGDQLANPTVQQLYQGLGLTNGYIPLTYNNVVLRQDLLRNLSGLSDPDGKFNFKAAASGSSDKRSLTIAAGQALVNLLNAMLADPTLSSKFNYIWFNSGYRSFAVQQSLTANPTLNENAATPGYSMHGWGLAVDLQWGVTISNHSIATTGLDGFQSAVYQWLHNNASTYGWYNGNPDGRLYNGITGRRNEFWHWEYWGNASSPTAGSFTAAALPKVYQVGSDKNTNVTPTTSSNVNGTPGPVKNALPGNDNNVNNNQNKLSGLFKQINDNNQSLEADQTDVDWGQRGSGDETSDWIGLKQFLLYLCTRYMPQAVYPFVELIPSFDMSSYEKDGNVPKDVQNLKMSDNIISKSLSSSLKFLSEPPAGLNVDKYNQNAQFQNSAKGQQSIDLTNIDPFQTEILQMGVLSDAGKTVLKQRNIGLRVYGQLVLNPTDIPGTPDKPGAIGFTEIDVEAGSQSDNGLSLITMKLVDVQGNKFTDIASPWAFIFDSRPGSEAGDFYFRYGWSLRVPPASDEDIKKNPISREFWNHRGWKIWDEKLKSEIRRKVIPGIELITLTQSNTIGNTNADVQTDRSELQTNIGSVFGSETFDPNTGIISVNRQLLETSVYQKISLLNPELEMDENGAITATLKFRTAGAITAKCYLQNSKITASTIKSCEKTNTLTLTDLLSAIQADHAYNSILNVTDKTVKAKREAQIANQAAFYKQNGNVNSLVKVVGADGPSQFINPTDVVIKISKRQRSKLYQAITKQDGNDILIGWLREVLNENDCTLLSAAEGSGSGINSAFVITTTQNILNIKVQKLVATSNLTQQEALARITSEQIIESQTGQTKLDNISELLTGSDVFSYRFQGSLVENIKIEKSSTPNQMTIAADFLLSDFPSFETRSESGNTQVTAFNRKRNLAVIYAQMQNGVIECLCHPWVFPGQTVYIKGMGFFDGEYLVLKINHNLKKGEFKSEIEVARILPKDNPMTGSSNKTWAQMNGKSNFVTPITSQQQ